MELVAFGGIRELSFAASMFLLLFERKLYRMHLRVNDEHIRGRIMTVCVGSARGYGLTRVRFLIMAGLMYLLYTVPNCCSCFQGYECY